MTTTPTADVESTLQQIRRLETVGCEIVRVTVNTEEAADALPEIKAGISIPLVADIHFDHRLALRAVLAGVDCLRINPGNIGSDRKITEVVAACRDRGIPIRIGVNGGSLEKEILKEFDGPTPEALVASGMRHIHLLEDRGFNAIKISLKSSDVPTTIRAYTLLAQRCDYPFHLGVTEAGTLLTGAVKSAIGLGTLLMAGIGDTLRVSLAADPVEEVKVGHSILRALGLRRVGINVIACPTCGRLEMDVIEMAAEVERRLATIRQPLNIAVMGCVVNGPGEGKSADYAITGGHGVGYLYRRGELLQKYEEPRRMMEDLITMVEREAAEEPIE